MAEALVSVVLTQLTTIVSGDAGEEIRLVLGVKEDVRKLKSKFEAVQKVLADAENKLEDPNVRRWLDGFKKLAYDMEDVLDEWNTLILKRQSITRKSKEFDVSDSNHAEEASSIEGLKYLKDLQGSLRISRLENMRDVNEAKEAELHNKTKLTSLGLYFDASDEEESIRTAEDHEQLLDALQPLPPNLQRLVIAHYRGKYISQIFQTPLIQLRELRIDCDNLEYLPPLGKLPSLDSLFLNYALRLKNVSTRFLGVESGILTSMSPASPITVFPKLTYLSFSRMFEWEEWDYGIIGKDENIQIMPSLRSLMICDCPKLKALPDHLFLNASLKKLNIGICPLLYSYLKERGQQWPLNFHIPQISYYGSTEDNSNSKKYKTVIDPKGKSYSGSFKLAGQSS